MGPTRSVSSGGSVNRPQVTLNAELGWSRNDEGFIPSRQPAGVLLQLGRGEPFAGTQPESRNRVAGDGEGAQHVSAMPEFIKLDVGDEVLGAVPAHSQPLDEDSGDSDDGEDSEGLIVPSTSPDTLQVSSRVNLQGSLTGQEEGVRCMPRGFFKPQASPDSAGAGIQEPRVLYATRVTKKSFLISQQFTETFKLSQFQIQEIEDQYIEGQYHGNPKVQSNIFSPIVQLYERITKRWNAYTFLQRDGSNPDEEARLEEVLVRLMARVIELSEILNNHKDNLENVSFEGWHDGNPKKGRSHINSVVITKTDGQKKTELLKTSVQKEDGNTPNYKKLDKIKMAQYGEVCFEGQIARPFHQGEASDRALFLAQCVDSRGQSRTPDSNQGADKSRAWGQVQEERLYYSRDERQAFHQTQSVRDDLQPLGQKNLYETSSSTGNGKARVVSYSQEDLKPMDSARSLSFLGIPGSHQIPVEGTVQAGGASGLPSSQLGTSGMGLDPRSSAFTTVGSEVLPLRRYLGGGREDQGVYLQGAITRHPVARFDLQSGSLPNFCGSAHLAQQQDERPSFMYA